MQLRSLMLYGDRAVAIILAIFTLAILIKAAWAFW
jgi:hypothetical protein